MRRIALKTETNTTNAAAADTERTNQFRKQGITTAHGHRITTQHIRTGAAIQAVRLLKQTIIITADGTGLQGKM